MILPPLCATTGREQVQQETYVVPRLFDHLVGHHEQLVWHGKAKRLDGREINNEIELGWLLDRDVARLRPAQNLVDVVGGAPEPVWEAYSIGHETSRFDVVPRPVHRR